MSLSVKGNETYLVKIRLLAHDLPFELLDPARLRRQLAPKDVHLKHQMPLRDDQCAPFAQESVVRKLNCRQVGSSHRQRLVEQTHFKEGRSACLDRQLQ